MRASTVEAHVVTPWGGSRAGHGVGLIMVVQSRKIWGLVICHVQKVENCEEFALLAS